MLLMTELLLTLISLREDSSLTFLLKETDTSVVGSTDKFLKSRLRYEKDENGQELCLLKINDEEEVGVMMGWEREISESSVLSFWVF